MEITTKRNIGDTVYAIFQDKIRELIIANLSVTISTSLSTDKPVQIESYHLKDKSGVYVAFKNATECFDSKQELYDSLQ